MMMSIENHLEALVDLGELIGDPVQIEATKALDGLLSRLDGYSNKSGFFTRRQEAPLGLYMWGGVGRGKSMLMDWFFDRIQQTQKQRVHFHAFMLDVHERIAHWRSLSPAERRKHKDYVRGVGDDPIAPTAKAISEKALVLCFDEFHVTDIADAMILSRLFEALWERGVVVLATSNREPDELYKHGLNRGLFLPFIDLLKRNMIVHAFDGDVDHRLRQLTAAPVYYTPLGDGADLAIESTWARLTGGAIAKPTTLRVQGRELTLENTAAGTARTNFNRLCGRPLGPADYLRLSQAFQTLILERVPQMGPHMRNEAKRFVTLIDALYETRTKLVMSAAVEPDQLYIEGTGAFEFERTVSRLMEMRTEEYLGARREWGDQKSGQG